MKKTSLLAIVAVVVIGFLAINFSSNLFSFGGDSGVYVIETEFGQIKVRLYDQTPKHKESFMKLVKDKVFENAAFTQNYDNEAMIGGNFSADGTDRGATIEKEIVDSLHLKFGALVAYPSETGEGSSDDKFILVKGKKYTKDELIQIEKQAIVANLQRDPENSAQMAKIEALAQKHQEDSARALYDAMINKLKLKADTQYLAGLGKLFTPEQINIFTTVGGLPMYEGKMTVFGEVIEGMDVLEKLLKAEADRSGVLVKKVPMKIKND